MYINKLKMLQVEIKVRNKPVVVKPILLPEAKSIRLKPAAV